MPAMPQEEVVPQATTGADPYDKPYEPCDFTARERARLTALRVRVEQGRVHELDLDRRTTERLLFTRWQIQQGRLTND